MLFLCMKHGCELPAGRSTLRGRTAVGGGAADASSEELRDELPASATEADAMETEPTAASSTTRAHSGQKDAIISA